MRPNLRLVRHVTAEEGDWEALYIDGKIYHQGQDIPTHVWLSAMSALGADVAFQENYKSEWLADHGYSLPEEIRDLHSEFYYG